MNQGTNINPEIFQEMLDSASNAGAKGQSQFFTPVDWAQTLLEPLSLYRKTIVDLNCGAGHLLQACANKTTKYLLGADIDPCRGVTAPNLAPHAKMERIVADVTKLYALMADVNWRADLFVLNPPWDLFFYREPLAALNESEVKAVREAYRQHDGRTAAGTIDSTVAMLLIALDRMTYAGDGLLIANNATLERLLFDQGAPHRALAEHIWGHIVIEGNPMTKIKDSAFTDEFRTGVIYFARDHRAGVQMRELPKPYSLARPIVRRGARISESWHGDENTVPLWKAVVNEWTNRQKDKRTDYNIYLSPEGDIKTNLSLYEKQAMNEGRCQRILKEHAEQLYGLNGKRPMQLVLQRSQRELLLRHCGLADQGAFPWRVQPALQQAVLDAVREYHSVRAPLYPLPGLQRLGYLEEEDSILCKKTMPGVYVAGNRYAISTQSVQVVRRGLKPNLEGDMEEMEYSGSELATYIKDESGNLRCFMEARLKDSNVEIDGYNAAVKIEFTLQELDEHFVIPEVPDVAEVNPEAFQSAMAQLNQLEELINL